MTSHVKMGVHKLSGVLAFEGDLIENISRDPVQMNSCCVTVTSCDYMDHADLLIVLVVCLSLMAVVDSYCSKKKVGNFCVTLVVGYWCCYYILEI